METKEQAKEKLIPVVKFNVDKAIGGKAYIAWFLVTIGKLWGRIGASAIEINVIIEDQPTGDIPCQNIHDGIEFIKATVLNACDQLLAIDEKDDYTNWQIDQYISLRHMLLGAQEALIPSPSNNGKKRKADELVTKKQNNNDNNNNNNNNNNKNE